MLYMCVIFVRFLLFSCSLLCFLYPYLMKFSHILPPVHSVICLFPLPSNNIVLARIGTYEWEVDEATGDAKASSLKVNRHPCRCCLDKHPSWTEAGKQQQACTDVATQTCKDIKADDAVCKAANQTKESFYTEGYTYSACNNYADDCRSSLTCDTAGGFSGYPDLACRTGASSHTY